MAGTIDLTTDHRRLDEDLAARRYFATFARITAIMAGVAAEMQAQGLLTAQESDILGRYATRIAATFRALSMKYLIAGRLDGVAARHLTIDLHESGFPIYQELVQMANDAAQAARVLEGLPPAAQIRDDMIRQMLSEQVVPTRLQYAMSQRIYHEALVAGGLFLPQMAPEAQWLADLEGGRRRFLIHWAVYDSQTNLPVIHLMEVEDAGGRALPRDDRRWPAVQAHLMAQSVGALKLLTIATGFDRDFADLHPKRLRRVHVGPMHSAAFTLQTGPIREVLDEAKAGAADDWALAWAFEDLDSERVEIEKGWFAQSEREVFRLDPLAPDSGATRITRAIVLPERPFQVLAEKDPPGFRSVRRYVVGRTGRVLSYG